MPPAKMKGTRKKKSRHASEALFAPPTQDRRGWWVAISLAVAVIALYGRVLGNQFINFDDGPYILDNNHVKAALTLDGLWWAFTATGGFYWHPITWLSHMLDVELFGLNAAAHHLVNVLWHAVNAAVLLIFLWRVTGHLWRSAFTAALFALHPLRVESVAWAAERKDVLGTFFYLCTLWAYVRYTGRPQSWRRYAAVAAWLSLGLMAKPSVVTAPFVFLLLDYWPLVRKEHLTVLLREKVPFFMLSAAVSVVTYIAQKQAGAMSALENLAVSGQLANAVVSYVHYLGKIIWPYPLAVVYPHPRHLPALPVILSFLLLAAITAVTVWLGGNLRYLPFGWFWFLGTLVPMIGIVQVGFQAYADRFSYVPSIGIFVAMVWMAADIFERRKWRLAAPVAAATILPALAFTTWCQLPYWHDDRTLWQHAVDSTSANTIALYNLGKDLLEDGRSTEAIPHLEQVKRLQPDFYPTYYTLGKAQAAQGETAPAIRSFSEAVRLKPDYAEAYYARAAIFMKNGNIQGAAPDFRQALKYGPAAVWAADAHHGLGVILAQQHDLRGATDEFQRAVLLRPDLVEAQQNLARALAGQGRIPEAISRLQEALSVTHGNAVIRGMLDDLRARR